MATNTPEPQRQGSDNPQEALPPGADDRRPHRQPCLFCGSYFAPWREDPMTPPDLSMPEATGRVLLVLRADPETSPKLLKEVPRFAQAMRRRGATRLGEVTDELVHEYLTAVTFRHKQPRDPAPSTQITRRWAARTFFEVARRLGLTDRAVAIDLEVPGRLGLAARPLRDDEVWACEQAARMTLDTTRAPAVLALAEAGGDAGEIANVTIGDIDLDQRLVRFRGHVGHRPRTNPLTKWQAEAIRRQLERLGDQGPDTPLVVSPGVTGASATASISGELGQILQRAGIADDPAVQPRSIRAWSGLRLWEETHDFGAVANWLGANSLDQAAAIVGIDWRRL